ncbi:MAG: hypothetical protein ACOYMH_05815, partial [Zwartia sp.]
HRSTPKAKLFLLRLLQTTSPKKPKLSTYNLRRQTVFEVPLNFCVERVDTRKATSYLSNVS